MAYVTAAQLGSDKTTCDAWFMGSGKDVIVPAGAVCHLLPGTHVMHDLTVQKGGTLDAHGITVDHDLGGDGAATVCGGSVGHDLAVQNSTAGLGPILVGDIGGDCSAGNTVGHDLTVQNNAGAVDVGNNTVTHDIRVQDNKPGGATVNANSAGHDAVCQGNSPQVGSGNAAIHSNTCP